MAEQDTITVSEYIAEQERLEQVRQSAFAISSLLDLSFSLSLLNLVVLAIDNVSRFSFSCLRFQEARELFPKKFDIVCRTAPVIGIPRLKFLTLFFSALR